MKKKYQFVFLLIVAFSAEAQDSKSHWVDSTLQTMSLREKITQTFMFPVSLDVLRSEEPGFMLVSDRLTEQTALLNHVQEISKVPVMFAIQSQWSVTDSDNSGRYPPVVQSSWSEDSLNYTMGRRIAARLRTAGIHLALYPPHAGLYKGGTDYADFYSNDPQRAARKSTKFLRGLNDNGLQSIGFISDGTSGSADSTFIAMKSTTGFGGLTFCYVHAKAGKRTKKGDAELLSFERGYDVLINPHDPGATVRRIQKLIKKHPDKLERLNASVRNILMAKYDAGLSKSKSVDLDQLKEHLTNTADKLLSQQLAAASVVVARNKFSYIPLRALDNKKFLSVSLGIDSNNEFDRYLLRYAPFEEIALKQFSDTTGLNVRLLAADVIVLGIYDTGRELQRDVVALFQNLPPEKQVIICNFGNPASLKFWQGSPTLLSTASSDPMLLHAAAQVIFGGIGSNGQLPFDITEDLRAGAGELSPSNDRLSFSLPESAGMDSKTLNGVKTIAEEAIAMKATPGCRVLVARHGKVVYDESFGFLTYENKAAVNEQTIYDMASVTKVSATLQTVMFMHERGLIDINKKISVYLPEFKGTDKENFIIKDILTHQAGLWPFLPFWLQTMKDSTYLPEYYSHEFSEAYPYQVADNLFATKTIKDSLWSWIVHAKIIAPVNRTPYTYRYSDMGFYIMQHLAEKMLNQPLEDFVAQNFYEPLGAYSTGFLPRRRFPASRIAPTEDDKTFRKSLLIGYVHDQGAALYGGIAGHAGLFSTAYDMAKLGQMWLQKGSYGGGFYFRPATVDFFTQKQFENSRRGLGWDRPVASDADGPTSVYSSQKTFGHTGFTGTCIWVDPEFDLVYIFLSNRVYPEMTNNKILNANIRPRIQDVIYKSIFTYCRTHN